MVKLYRKNISEPWFSLIAVGCKTVEGRLNKGDWEKMEEGDQIDWYNKEMEPLIKREYRTVILKKTHYPSFENYLENEGLRNTLPSIEDPNDGLKIYQTYYSEEDEKIYGVIALELRVISKY